MVNEWERVTNAYAADGLVHLLWRNTRTLEGSMFKDSFLCRNSVFVYTASGGAVAHPTDDPLTCFACIAMAAR